jgi:hypothetical protein
MIMVFWSLVTYRKSIATWAPVTNKVVARLGRRKKDDIAATLDSELGTKKI